MVILKKIKAATLIEVLVASVIILIVFIIGSLSLNNIFVSGIKNNDALLESRLSELTYLISHEKVQIPFYEETENYDIAIEKREGDIIIQSVHKPSNQERTLIISE